jgi:hypothetical protein
MNDVDALTVELRRLVADHLPECGDVPWTEIDEGFRRASRLKPNRPARELLGIISLMTNEMGHEAKRDGDEAKVERCIYATRVLTELTRSLVRNGP